jgi:hypothetical protein
MVGSVLGTQVFMIVQFEHKTAPCWVMRGVCHHTGMLSAWGPKHVLLPSAGGCRVGGADTGAARAVQVGAAKLTTRFHAVSLQLLCGVWALQQEAL